MTTTFTRARWAVGLSSMLAVGAIARYPGGNRVDHASLGYSVFRNFLSDLGMTISFSGQPNMLGATFFVLSLLLVVLGLGGCLIGFVRLCSESSRQRQLARGAAGVGLIVCAAFIGVALTPENQLMSLHIWLTLFAFRVLPVAALLMVLASMSSRVLPRRITVAWAILTVVLTAYVYVIGWGPPTSTTEGLTFQVTAQKLVAIASVSILVYLSVQADRVVATVRRDR
jgi:hypothetical protein